MTTSELQLAVAETLGVYQTLDEECRSHIPKEFMDFLEENYDPNIEVQITKLVPLDMQEISKEGFRLIAKMYGYIIKN